jgi:VanZ family protein
VIQLKGRDSGESVYVRTLGALSAGVLCLILTAGLWPFCAPKNDVEWLTSGDGLKFGHHGSVVSSGAIRGADQSRTSGTLEVWLGASRSESSSTILSFDESAHPGEPFSLRQFGNSLVIRRNNVDPNGISRTALFTVDGLFQRNQQPVCVVVTLNARGMSVWVNGGLAKSFPLSGTWNDLTGRIVLANSPTANNSWAGRITRLAIYQQELTASEIAADYANWRADRKPKLARDETPVALYLFNEHDGTVAHNNLDAATDLVIPTRYFVLHQEFMRTPWREYHRTRGYCEDIFINVAGFVPFGFCLFAYLTSLQVGKHPAATTVCMGLLTSLTIEVLQSFLPTRDSGMTDLITNTLGTAIGVMICRSVVGQTLLGKARAAIARAVFAGQEVRYRS